jgi:hypothetical protein
MNCYRHQEVTRIPLRWECSGPDFTKQPRVRSKPGINPDLTVTLDFHPFLSPSRINCPTTRVAFRSRLLHQLSCLCQVLCSRANGRLSHGPLSLRDHLVGPRKIDRLPRRTDRNAAMPSSPSERCHQSDKAITGRTRPLARKTPDNVRS